MKRLLSLLVLLAACEAHSDARNDQKRRLLRIQDSLPAALSVTADGSFAGIDCSWSDWSAWSFCSVTCGEGLQERKRWVAVREQGGSPCTGSAEQHGPCTNEVPCGNATNGCDWEDWQDWSMCTSSCEGGRRQRVRAVKSAGTGCSLADGRQAEDCGQPCGTDASAASDQADGCWTEWSSCSQSCAGVRARKNKEHEAGCPKASQEELCNMEACNCQLSDWSDWSKCSGPCQNSQAVSVRKREAQSSTSDAGACNRSAVETKSCDCVAVKDGAANPSMTQAPAEPVDCAWAKWQDWEACSKSCGSGSRKRSRTVRVAANDLGRDCVGEDRQSESCKGETCPSCDTSDWSEWSECTGPCLFLSSRSIRVREPLSAGTCDKSLEEERACTCNSESEAEKAAAAAAAAAQRRAAAKESGEHSSDEEVAIDCQWAAWHDWEVCSKSCDTGITRRSRDVLRSANALGSECLGEKRQTQNCNAKVCPCAVGDWSDWSSCAGDCDGASDRAVRTRELRDHVRHNATEGGHCTEVLEQEKACTCISARSHGADSADSDADDTMTAADLRAQDLDADTATKASKVADPDQRRVSGALALALPDPVSFSSDANAETAVQNTLNSLIGSLKDSYSISVSLMPTPDGKASVDCWYSLILTEEEAGAVAAKLHAVEITEATQRLGEELQKLGISVSVTATKITATVTSTNT